MSKYTTELKMLIDSGYDIGLDDYPIYDAAYRAVLNQKIIDHYSFCEIGAETPARFKLFLNRTMREIMPYYNQLYLSAALTLNPLANFSLVESTSREGSGSSLAIGENEGTIEDDNLTVGSDMPQNLLSVADIKSNLYAAQASRGDNTTTNSASSTQTASSSSLEVYTRNLSGLQGQTQAKALEEFRSTFLNIDMKVIADLASCFMGVW